MAPMPMCPEINDLLEDLKKFLKLYIIHIFFFQTIIFIFFKFLLMRYFTSTPRLQTFHIQHYLGGIAKLMNLLLLKPKEFSRLYKKLQQYSFTHSVLLNHVYHETCLLTPNSISENEDDRNLIATDSTDIFFKLLIFDWGNFDKFIFFSTTVLIPHFIIFCLSIFTVIIFCS